MNQLVIQTADFWKTQFQVTDEAVETLYNSILEAGEPQSIDAIGLFFVKHTIEEEERKMRSEIEHGKLYLPHQNYVVDDNIIFPHLSFAMGTVVNTRPGYNPADGEFTVLEVVFGDQGSIAANFAANLKTPHALLAAENDDADGDGSSTIQKTYGQFQHLIRPRIEAGLHNSDDFVDFNRVWFLRDLLVEVQEGLLNIVDAAIDINNAPLNVDALIAHIELQGADKITESLRFSVNYRLEHDDRFDNVGTEETVLWYLNRLKPPRVLRPPRRLRESDLSFNINLLDVEQRALLAEIDDEATPAEYTKSLDLDATSVTFILNYHHRRLGTLPVLPQVEHLLPQVDDERVVALQLIDGRSGNSVLCWYVSQHKYILGLEDWYAQNQLPVGAVITLAKTDVPLQLVVNFVSRRTQQEYIRVATVKNNQLAFEMKKRRLSCKYDELMIIGEEGSEQIDALWAKVEKDKLSIYDLLVQILPELVRLTSQGAVHIKTIYSAVNVLKRCSPGLLMQELIGYDSFVSMGHGYWTYKPAGIN